MAEVAGRTLELRGISRSFGSGSDALAVLDDVTLIAAAGEFVTVIGPSGSGKSTLFGIAAGLDRPDRGDILVDGRVVTGRSDAFALMPQSDLLMPWRRLVSNAAIGLEVAGMGRGEREVRVDSLLDRFGLRGFERAYPHELSGGMRQRVALLRTIVQGRPMLLLDEPLGALDSLTRMDLQVWLADIWARDRWTVLLITHDIREAVYLSDRVYVLSPRPGAIVAEIAIDLPRPRPVHVVTTPAFAAYEGALLDALRIGS